jgi:hypothetical protein
MNQSQLDMVMQRADEWGLAREDLAFTIAEHGDVVSVSAECDSARNAFIMCLATLDVDHSHSVAICKLHAALAGMRARNTALVNVRGQQGRRLSKLERENGALRQPDSKHDEVQPIGKAVALRGGGDRVRGTVCNIRG